MSTKDEMLDQLLYYTDELIHYGMPRRSGRYPYGSGDHPYQHAVDFLGRVEELRNDKNFSFTDENGKKFTGDTAIAKSMGLTSTQFRAQYSLAKDERRGLQVSKAKALREKGYSLQAIADEMGFKNDSSVRSLLNEQSEARMNAAKATRDILKRSIDEKGVIDIGAGVERELGVSREKMEQAVHMLEMEGYVTAGGRIKQVTNPDKATTSKVIGPPGTPASAAYDFNNIHTVTDYKSTDGGDTFHKAFTYPASMDSKRLKIRYAEEGGVDKDGLIEIRRGCDDLDLGNSRYAQVRILVDGNRYLKGMAVYSDGKDMPKGVDVIFNSNKSKDLPKMEHLKKIKNDPENPFGSLIKENGGQYWYKDKDGKEKLGLINKKSDEGDWSEWADKIPSQFLGKQQLSLINKQLDLTKQEKMAEYRDILSINNPTIKKHYLQSFAEDCDSSAEHLKAASLPRQKYQVILPLTTIKDNEVYAPNYRDGEKVALIRYPHEGTFEIPICKVNNKLPEGIKMMGKNPTDAVGISRKVAEQMSGADFDGDTVMVIPTGKNVKITATPPLKGLEGFDNKMKYGSVEGEDGKYYVGEGKNRRQIKIMSNTQNEMGRISNLITDMTLKGAGEDELAAAVRHSMVVIDAEKHKLDYKQSYIDNNIAALKKKWQGHFEDGKYKEGASTLLSRSKGQKDIIKRVGSPKIDPKTGKLIYKESVEEYKDPKTGKIKVRMQESTQMRETDDAYTLSSGTKKEAAYADYANYLKDLGNKARLEYLNTGNLKYSPSAKKTYAEEVKTLNSKLNISLLNAPKERAAQRIANSVMEAKKASNPDMTKKEAKKLADQALKNARLQVGAKRKHIDITDKEWEAIQAGAISDNTLAKILRFADADELRARATPYAKGKLTSGQLTRISAMRDRGYSVQQIADLMGISKSTISKYS